MAATAARRPGLVWLWGVFILLTLAYLALAHVVLAPFDYYGSVYEPRFADPWIARAETILRGGLLYRDVPTMTPSLVNLLLIPPVLVSGSFGHQNPAATLAFMLYFALFTLATAHLLYVAAAERAAGRAAALAFLLNPLTLGNAILRRQDEAILVFGFALTLLWLGRRQHTRAALALGATLLIKLTGALLIPVALRHSQRRRYLVLPGLVFALALAPFLLLAGQQALFFNTGQRDAQHPFQFDGLNPFALLYAARGSLPPDGVLWAWSAVFLVGMAGALALIMRRPRGIWEDLSLLLGVTLLLTPKLHCGYYALLALSMAPLARPYRLGGWLWLLGLLVLVADVIKWPAERFLAALLLMLLAQGLLVGMLVRLRRGPAPAPAPTPLPARVTRSPWRPGLAAGTLALGLAMIAGALALPRTQHYDIGAPADYVVVSAMFEREQRDGLSYRWTRAGDRLTLHGAYGGPALLQLHLYAEPPAAGRDNRLSLRSEQQVLAMFAPQPGWRVYQLLLPAGTLHTSGVGARPVALVSASYAPGPGDARPRGVALDWLSLAPLAGAAPQLGRGLLQALLLTTGLALAWLAGWYVLTVAAGPLSANQARSLLLAGMLAMGGLVWWALVDPAGLAWALPLSPALLLGGAMLVGGLVWYRCTGK